ncbi:MAG: flotillin family protein [Rhodospirillaceae bacterium]|nr:flotillin family protein [Rhodospirillaceae bacterium]MYB14903.1 flotillin family protein [Rhodospirillaceae bacterium]MYI48925.1 flotillin family protein [Rhodospirillaceae bacterium]
MTLGNAVLAIVIALVAIVVLWLLFWWLYRRATKELSFVRTGFGGQKVVMNGGALVLPVLHDIIQVNMNALRIDVARAARNALITRDRLRVDVSADFLVRVGADHEAIATAAQSLGTKTLRVELLKELIEGRLTDALRSVAAEMSMEELHEKRIEFVRRVRETLADDLASIGLELQSVSLTSLDQTDREHFNPQNAFDAEGLTRLTQEIENRRRQRNEIEQDTEVEIQARNLKAEQEKLEIARDEEFARLEQERAVSTRRAEQRSEVAAREAEKEREMEEARIASGKAIDLAKVASDQEIEARRIAAEQEVRERDIERDIAVELARHNRSIEIDTRAKEQSKVRAEAEEARADAERAAEAVETVREIERAERQKRIDLIEAQREAEKSAIDTVSSATAKREAAGELAEADRLQTDSEAGRIKAMAEAESEGEKLRAAAMELRSSIEAAAKRAMNDADSGLSPELIDMKIRLAIVEHLQGMIAESVKPLERIEGIKIVHVDGLAPQSGGGAGAADGEKRETGLSDQIVNSALRYRAHAPVLDQLLKDVGFSAGDPEELQSALTRMLRSGDGGEAGGEME